MATHVAVDDERLRPSQCWCCGAVDDPVRLGHLDSNQRLRLELRPGPEVASRAAGLAAKETGCCSFFTFDLAIADGTVTLGIQTGAAHEAVLAALGVRAESQLAAAS